MGDLPPRRIRIRRERLTAWSRVAWLLLAVFIAAGSAGTWAANGPAIWAPTLVVPADVFRNVLLYVPFGALGLLSLERRQWRGAAKVALIGVLFSVLNEVLQLYTVDRVASLTDIASAGLGSLAGALAVAFRREPK